MMRSSLCVLAGLFAGRVASHPLCFIDDKPTDFDQVLTFCPEAQDGACCTDIEEDNVSAAVDAVGPISTECRELYKKVVCGVCHSYSAHLYERLGAELGALDGMTMKQDFCDELVDACADEIPGIARTYPGGLSYCEKHVGSTGDQFWSFPYEEPEIFEPGLNFVFPDLDNDDDFPRSTISLRQTPDGSSFWLVGQQGEVKKVDADDLDSISTVIDVSDNGVFYVAFEEGLLDMTFDPMFGVSGSPDIFYLSYTCQLNDGENPRNRISKFEYFPGDESATLASEEVLLTTKPKFNSIHSAGWCGFKHSDYGDGNSFHDLYWTTGDGGPQTDTLNTGQDTSNMLGSMMRISVPSDGTGYNIPSGNLQSGMPEICASGLRNPFRCSFDRETDVLYCGDVGHTNVEEIDIIECGENYGWSRFEGSRCQEAQESRDGDCQGASRSGFTFPWFEYCHPDYFSTGDEDEFTGNQNICGDRFITGHAVIGGYVYRGNYFSDLLTGAYIFGDATNRNIYYLVEVEGELVLGTIVSDSSVAIISFSEDINGELMMITRNHQIYHMPCGDLCASTCLAQSEDNVEAEYQGCFADDSKDRVLTLAESDCGEGERAMNAQICASYCDTLGAKYSGVEFSFECFCGNNEDFDRLGELPESSCEMLCTANPDEFCGGNGAIQVYEISSSIRPSVTPAPFVSPGEGTPAPTVAVETPAPSEGDTATPAPMGVVTGAGTFIGCFTDTSDGRIMTKALTETPMGSEICQGMCSDSLFYGTQFFNECWCGGQRTDYDVHGPSTACTAPCAGNTGEICGGTFAMSVYENDGGGGGTPPATPSPMADPTPAPVIGSTPAPMADPTPAPIVDPTPAPIVDPTPAPIVDPTPAPVIGSTPAPTAVVDPTPGPISVLTPAPIMVVAERTPSPIRFLDSSTIPDPVGDTQAPVGDVGPPASSAFLGCFGDVKGDRIMSDGPNSDSPMSAEICLEMCGTVFYGTQFGVECWCGDESTDYDANGTATCDFACAGNAGEICGGRNAMSVYFSGSGTPPNPEPQTTPVADGPAPSLLGCFTDLKSDRIMTDQVTSSSMTAEACAALCDGNPFFGTQFGEECWCGDDSDYDRHGTAVCDMDCTGDASETCGGRNAMSVYDISS